VYAVLLARALTAGCSATVYDLEVSPRYFAEATELARELGDRWSLSQILGQRAQAAVMAGDTRSMRVASEEGREVADAIGDRFGSRQCGWRLGAAQICAGGKGGGITELRRVIADAEVDHDEISRMTALLVLPQALAFRGDTTEGR